MASSLVVDGVILSPAALQVELTISRYDAVCHERSPFDSSSPVLVERSGQALGPLVKTRALRDDALYGSKSKTEPLPSSSSDVARRIVLRFQNTRTRINKIPPIGCAP